MRLLMERIRCALTRTRWIVLWRFCKLLGKAKEIEIEWQRIQQDEHDAYFKFQIFRGNEQAEHAYKKGIAEGIKWCLNRFS